MADFTRPLRPLAFLTVSLALACLWLHPGFDRPILVALAILLLWPALALGRPVPWRRWLQAWNAVMALALGLALAVWATVPGWELVALVAIIILAELRWAYNPGGAGHLRRGARPFTHVHALRGRARRPGHRRRNDQYA